MCGSGATSSLRAIRLLLLSNTNEMHSRQFLAQFADTLAHFDHVVLSHQVGVRTPVLSRGAT